MIFSFSMGPLPTLDTYLIAHSDIQVAMNLIKKATRLLNTFAIVYSNRKWYSIGPKLELVLSLSLSGWSWTGPTEPNSFFLACALHLVGDLIISQAGLGLFFW